MPKKSATARAGAQRSKPKVQKNFELVRQASEDQKLADSSSNEPAPTTVSTATLPTTERRKEKASTAASPAVGNTSTRPARQQPKPLQKPQQRSAAPLITAEHYDYVRKDLVIIGVLASAMFAVIIVLYFVLGASA